MSAAHTIVYFGTSEFAVPPLLALLQDGRFKVVAVVTQPDKPAGRRGEVKASPVAVAARARGLNLLQPPRLREVSVVETLAGLKADLFVVAAYGKILPQNILDLPRLGSYNLHGSLLPAHRGASPIQAAILSGAARTGVTLMRMDDQMDHGPLLAAAETDIAPDDTHGSLERRLAELAAGLLTANLAAAAAGTLEPREQDHDRATFTKILDRRDGFVAWKDESAAEIERKMRAFDPWPGVYAVWKRPDGRSLRLKIIAARPLAAAGEAGPPGTVFVAARKNPAVWTRDGPLELIEVQIEGKKPVSGQALLNGHADLPGSVLPSEDV